MTELLKGKPPSSPILLASTLRRSLARIGFSGARFEWGYWASRCRLAAGKRDAAFFSGQEALWRRLEEAFRQFILLL